MKCEHSTFATPDGWRFRLVLSRSTYSITVEHDGKRVARAPEKGRRWGQSGTDALAMAVYRGDPAPGAGFMHYLFGPDHRVMLDAWDRSTLEPKGSNQ